MAPPTNDALLKRYQTWLTRSRNWRENDYDDTWRRMRDLYRGKQFESGGTDDQLIVNMAFATINVLAPSVSVSNPRFTVNARRPERQAQATITEEVVNYLWRTFRYQDQFRACVNDWLIFGHGWVKVGYKFVTKPKAVPANPDDADDAEQGIDDREDKEGNVESELDVLDDRPFTERVSPFDMYVDDQSKTTADMRWIAQRIRRPVADVRVDKRYSPSTRKKAQATSAGRFDDEDNPVPRSEHAPTGVSDSGYCDVIEFYDIKRETYCVFVDGQTEGFLINPKDMPYDFGHPFLMMRNYEVPDVFYPIGELEEIEPQQLELNETRTQMLNHRRHYARKYLYMEDALDDIGVQALESDEDNTMVPVNAGQDINRVIIPMPSIGIPPDFYNQSEMIQNDMDKVSGVSDYMRGNMPQIRRTATEAAMVQDAQNSRSADKMARVETFLAQLGERIIQLMQQYMTGDQVVRVVGSSSMPLWLTYDKDYIQGEFDFEVEAGSTQPQNETFRRQSAMQMVDAMAPFVQAGVINVPELAKYVLQFGFGVKDPESFVAGPVEQQMTPGPDAAEHPDQAQAAQGPPAPALPPGQPPGQAGGPPPGPPPMQQGPPPPPPPGPPGFEGGPPPDVSTAGGLPPELVQGLPTDVIPVLAHILQSLPPQMAQSLVMQLSQMPPPQRMQAIQVLIQRFAQMQQQDQGGMQPGAPVPGGPPPGVPVPGGPPPGMGP